MELTKDGQAALDKILKAAKDNSIDIKGGKIRRTSSRFCLGVEHGDYNGTELFGVGTDRFIWLAYKPNGTKKIRLFSANFPDDGVIEFELGNVPEPKSPEIANCAPIVAAFHDERLVPVSVLMALIGYAVGNYGAFVAAWLCSLVA